MLILIPYIGNKSGLSQLLVSIQPQLQAEDDIYILDMSKEKTALKLAKLYGSTRCYIMVEPTDKDRFEALLYGFDYARKNGHQGTLIISDRCVISNTFIANLKRATKNHEWSFLYIDYTEVIRGIDTFDTNFKWFNSPETKVFDGLLDIDGNIVKKTSEHCMYASTEPSKLNGLGILMNEKVCILPDFLEGL